MSTKVIRSESATISYLRGLASLGVVIYHVREDLWVGWKAIRTLPSATLFDKAVSMLSIPAPYMGSGVILFFLLSGFCIALPYVGDRSRKFDFNEYGARRFFRIYPPYIFAIALTLVIEVVLRAINNDSLSPLSTYLANIFMIQNYTTGALTTNGVLWTLPIEMELYLTFPIVLYILTKYGTKVLLWATAAVSLTVMVFYLTGQGWLHDNFAMYWIIWTAGAVLARNYANDTLHSPSNWVVVGGFLSLAVALVLQTKGVESAHLELLFGCFYFSLLWLDLTSEHNWADKIPKLFASVLNKLGTCSYSLYLIHKPIFRLWGTLWIRHFGSKPVNFLIPLAFVVLILPIAWFVYKLVEAPSHILAKRMATAWRTQTV